MKTSIITKFAVRSLGRSYRRTLLSVIGVGVGCAVALFLTSFMRGSNDFGPLPTAVLAICGSRRPSGL
jgi:hypothetical protein